MIERLAVSGKMVIDLDDCEEPHLTLAELNKVMSERNQLKKQVLSIQEELSQYRPEYVDNASFTFSSWNDSNYPDIVQFVHLKWSN